MKLPFLLMKRSDLEHQHNYRVFLEDEIERIKSELARKQRVLSAVEEALPVIKDRVLREGVEAGKMYMKRELIRHIRSRRR